MFQISTKGRYGIRILYQLAINQKNGPMHLKDIASKEDLPLKYIEQIIPTLKSAQLIFARKGRNGGYHLSKNPEDISIKLIIETLEGDLAPTHCIESPHLCEKNSICQSRKIWIFIDQKIKTLLQNITLKDMIDDVIEI